jgi:hypothetical protein
MSWVGFIGAFLYWFGFGDTKKCLAKGLVGSDANSIEFEQRNKAVGAYAVTALLTGWTWKPVS